MHAAWHQAACPERIRGRSRLADAHGTRAAAGMRHRERLQQEIEEEETSRIFITDHQAWRVREGIDKCTPAIS